MRLEGKTQLRGNYGTAIDLLSAHNHIIDKARKFTKDLQATKHIRSSD